MKKILIEYTNIIAYTITGIIFGISFFLILLNLYHYEEISSIYIKSDTDYAVNSKLKEKIAKIKENINSFDINNYKGNNDPQSILNIQTRLNICTDKIDSKEFNNILDKKEININDVYEMQQFYQINISNECLIKQIYELTLDNNDINLTSLKELSPFIENNINELKSSTDYVRKVIKNNSSYHFNSYTSKVDIYNELEDSYYNILNNYTSSIDFIYDISEWFRRL